jgi:hypothetical protein
VRKQGKEERKIPMECIGKQVASRVRGDFRAEYVGYMEGYLRDRQRS